MSITWIAMALLQTPNATVTDGRISPLLSTYRACVQTNLQIFNRAGENIPSTVDAAMYACRNERAEIILKMTEEVDGQPARWSIERAEDFVVTLIDNSMREKLVVELFQLRSER